jgi:hypothetical protein
MQIQGAEGGADDKSDEDSGHHRGAGVAVSGVIEDLGKVVACGAGQIVTEVAKAKAESDDDGETKVPLRRIVQIMHQGTILDAFSTSSAI